MASRWAIRLGLAGALVWASGVRNAEARFHHHHHGGGGFGVPAAVGGGWASWWPMPVPIFPPVILISPISLMPAGPPLPPNLAGRAPWPHGMRGPVAAAPGMAPRPMAPVEAPKRVEPARANQFITVGDRLFRAGNLKRASDRYEQALASNPDSAAPRVRLAQIALMRGQYTEAANRLREAQATEPGWLMNAPDIQAIYGEPGDFRAPLAKLESHLQAHPNDRDGWLVLGAQLYLSGRTRQAADIFRRLADRPPDPTLAAFLEATTPPPAPAAKR